MEYHYSPPPPSSCASSCAASCCSHMAPPALRPLARDAARLRARGPGAAGGAHALGGGRGGRSLEAEGREVRDQVQPAHGRSAAVGIQAVPADPPHPPTVAPPHPNTVHSPRPAAREQCVPCPPSLQGLARIHSVLLCPLTRPQDRVLALMDSSITRI